MIWLPNESLVGRLISGKATETLLINRQAGTRGASDADASGKLFSQQASHAHELLIDLRNRSSIKHWLAHRLGWNYGEVVTWSMSENVMVGFRCYGCGKLSGVHIAPSHLFPPRTKTPAAGGR